MMPAIELIGMDGTLVPGLRRCRGVIASPSLSSLQSVAAGKHRKRRGDRRSRRWLLTGTAGAIVAVFAVGAVIVMRDSHPGSGSAAGSNAAAATAELRVTPAAGAVDVPLNSSVVVVATAGRLATVTVAGPDGQPIAGQVGADGTTWRSSGTLAPATTYTVTGDGTTPSGDP